MKKTFFTLIVTAIMISSFVLIGTLPVSAIEETTTTTSTTISTWYVDASNTTGTENGSQAYPYNTIGEAIDAASTGNTIIVADGTYNENVAIGKSLTLTGNTTDPSLVVIDGNDSGTVVTIDANNVTITGFTITGSGSTPLQDCGILTDQVTGCNIENNIISNNAGIGIALQMSNGNDIQNNTLDSNNIAGIGLMGASGNNILNNTSTNTIEYIDDGNHLGYGIVLASIDINSDNCPEITSNENIIDGNTCSDNDVDGIYLDDRCNDNTITNNIISGNSQNGIYCWKSSGNTITDNAITGNTLIGIQLMASQDNNIAGNSISGSDTGIKIRSGNTYDGSSWSHFVSTGNAVNYNNITGNTTYGVQYEDNDGYTDDDDILIDATNNWWGSADGPGGEGSGSGDNVSTNVDFDPWLGSAVVTEIQTIEIDGQEYNISDEGVLLEEVEITTGENNEIVIGISPGTVLLDDEGNPLSSIDVSGDPENTPSDDYILAYEFSPSGAVFDPAITIVITYNEDDIPAGVDEENLVIAYYDGIAGEWIEIAGIVDTVNNTITAYVTHFTSYALLAPETQVYTTTVTRTVTNNVIRSTTSTVAQGTITTVSFSTITEIQPITSTQTKTETATLQGPTVTNTQSITVPIVQQQTTTMTITSMVTNTEEVTNWPITIILLVAGLLAGGLIVTILIRKV